MADANGNPTTIREWRDFWQNTIHGGEVTGGVEFLNQRIAESGTDGDQEGDTVIAATSQMFYLLAQFDAKGTDNEPK